MLEFPTPRNDWRLDIVSILAVLGESNVKLNAHLITDRTMDMSTATSDASTIRSTGRET